MLPVKLATASGIIEKFSTFHADDSYSFRPSMFAGLSAALAARKEKADAGSVVSVGAGTATEYSSYSLAGSVPARAAHFGPYCGLINQGATCYLNSLLQALYCHEEFRAQVFSCRPVEQVEKCRAPVTRALQALFVEMQLGLCVCLRAPIRAHLDGHAAAPPSPTMPLARARVTPTPTPHTHYAHTAQE